MQEWLLQDDLGTPEQTFTEEQMRQGEEILKKFTEWYEAMRGMAKQALAFSVDQTYEDMRDFLLGLVTAFPQASRILVPRTWGIQHSRCICSCSLASWRQIQHMKSVPERMGHSS